MSGPRPTTSLVRRLLPSLVVLVILPLCAAVALLWHQHQQRMGELIAEDADEMTTDLEMVLGLQGAGLATAIQPITANAGVQRALGNADASGLLGTWQPVFESMRRENHVTHLYFYDRNRICLLRVHAPDQHGDRINRYTALEAELTGKAACGLERGPRGTLTLRVVQPVFTDGKVVGYVELGKEIEDALNTLRSHMEEWNQMAILVHKDRLDRQAWEETQRQLGREADWDRMPRHVVVLASQGHLPDAFLDWIDPKTNVSDPHLGSAEIPCDGKYWRIMATSLKDSSGAEIGNLIAMRDITGDRNTLIWQLVLGGSAGVLLLTLVLVFVHRLLARAEHRINVQQEEHLKLQQQKMARELGEMVHANRLVALGTMMAGLAHEFNHPAQVVLLNQKSLRSMVEACAATAKDIEGPAVGLLTWPEVAAIAPQLLDDMELATTQLSELIENVQNYARPSEGLCQTIDYAMLTSVSRSSLRLVASYARRCQVALVSEVDPACDMPSGCSCLQQIVVNLLINAIQASQAGDAVTIACQRRDGWISLAVSDSGPGIDPAVLKQLGQPFATTRKLQGGNGLGLFICMQLVAEQGGTLELTPRQPRGTMARVAYPDPTPA